MAVVALNIWTGSPLLALWVGSKVQGGGPPSMGAFGMVVLVLAVLSFALYQLMKMIGRAYDEATGVKPGARTHSPWLRSMRGERRDLPGAATLPVTALERVVVITVLLAAVAFEIWFFFFAGSPFA
jgi:predicted secreted protein